MVINLPKIIPYNNFYIISQISNIMLIKSIKLHNIRSYESAEINFPSGSVLLAGDIGAGKSTILLAIEFAIFGAKKGELPAYTLLRHGKKEGSVELRMQIDGKEIMIKEH